MSKTSIVYYREGEVVPILEWLGTLQPKAREVCLRRLRDLELEGHKLRRPHSARLVHGIYELRAKSRGINLRMLYFFHGKLAVVMSHGFQKQEGLVPFTEIHRAVQRMKRFEADREAHTHEAEI